MQQTDAAHAQVASKMSGRHTRRNSRSPADAATHHRPHLEMSGAGRCAKARQRGVAWSYVVRSTGLGRARAQCARSRVGAPSK
eukprot:scaffold7638_cov131-Isochrysis_galbana.AAC.1